MKGRGSSVIAAYAAWSFLVFAASFYLKGPDPDNVTHVLIIAFLLAQLAAYPLLSALAGRFGARSRFILFGMASAACVEGFYMVSAPVFPSLTVTAETGFASAVGNYVTDLAFTLPAYAVIFSVLWLLINRYAYGRWEYLLIMGLSQALGDGGAFFFLASPPMLAFLPYVMVNYHAMNLIPYLLVRDGLEPASASRWRYAVTPASIMVTYYLLGGAVRVVGSYLGYV